MSNGKTLIRGALILMLTGFLSRIIGFFYRIFLSRAIGAEGMGIYQLIFPLYSLCFALTVAGLQTVLSRFIAGKLALGQDKAARDGLAVGVFLSLSLSLAAGGLMFYFARPISLYFLQEPRCVSLLQLLSFCVPFGTVHACLSAWYYARKKTALPSVCQLLEQLARVGASILVYSILLERGLPVTPMVAVVGILAGECASALTSMIAVSLDFQKASYSLRRLEHPVGYSRELLLPALPLTANRLLLTLLQSLESVLIPGRLLLFGLSSSAALSVYGVLTGMALPLILFPSAITNAVSVMLLPTVAEEQAKGNRRTIAHTIENTIKYCLILGIFATGVFLFFGREAGLLLFGNEQAGAFIQTLAFICPFLYLTTTLSSILNGLGKTTFCFAQNLAGLIIRILFVLFLVPRYGMPGYLWGLLASELTITFLSFFLLHRIVPFTFSSWNWMIKPLLALAISGGVALAVCQLGALLPGFPPLLLLAFALLAMVCLYLYLLCGLELIHIPMKRHTVLDKK